MDDYIKPKDKKTRQGASKNTKYGNKVSKKYYKKRYRGPFNVNIVQGKSASAAGGKTSPS